uniref:Putative salivary kunitz domain protein n=1 Tax=Ixodes ricinus TaxID=34613 RepID=A0A6B0UMA6_IXORI
MRLSCILCFLAMCLFAYASDYADFEQLCTRKWPIPFFQCLFLCQHEEWKFLRPPPQFTVEQKLNGTYCRGYATMEGAYVKRMCPLHLCDQYTGGCPSVKFYVCHFITNSILKMMCNQK